MPVWMISEADVKKHPKYNKLSLAQILHSFGMDTTKPWADDGRWLEPVAVGDSPKSHRSIFSADDMKTYACPRYVGVARQDGDWKRFVNRFLDLPLEFMS